MTKPFAFRRLYFGPLFLAALALAGCGSHRVASSSTIVITAANPSIAAGQTAQLHATEYDSGNHTNDVTSLVTWNSSNAGVATVNTTGLLTGVASGSANISATLGTLSGSIPMTIGAAVIATLTVTPASPQIYTGGSQQFTATATYSDGSTKDLTSTVTWSATPSTVATISTAGLLTAVAAGAFTLTATSGTMVATVSGTITDATLASIAVSPATATIASGSTQQLTATGTYTDQSTKVLTGSVTWTSSNPSVLAINGQGLATAASVSSATAVTVTAQSGSLSGTATLTVTVPSATLTSLVVTPTSSQVVVNFSQQFAALGSYSDGSTRDISSSTTWSSSSMAVAQVNSSGKVTGVSAGVATITCTAGSLQSQTTVIINNASLQSVAISPSGASFAAGAEQQFSLTGTFSNAGRSDLTSVATWSSLSPSVATVSSTGLVTGIAPGTARISAVFGSQTATTTVQITAATLVSVALSPASAAFAKGTTEQFTVTGTYSDGTTHDVTGQATFLSSDATVLTVSTTGLATGAGAGTAHISVTVAGDHATTQTITVTPATLVSIAITPATPTFAKGTTQKFTAIGSFSDGTTQDLSNEVVWSSSTPQTATIDDFGLASSGVPGSTKISSTFRGVTGSSGVVQVSSAVLTSLAVSPTTVQIAKGTSQRLTATGTFSDGTTQDLSSTVTWSSSSPTVASIDANGVATGNSVGSAQMTAAFESSTASTASFQVTSATLVSISFSPANPGVAAGTSTQVTVTGTFSDSTTQDLTSSAIFSSSNPSAVTVNGSGLITGVAAGTSTVTVTVGRVTNSFTATVSTATLSSIAITPATPPSFAKGSSEQFTATGTFSDGSTQDLSSTVTWTSSNPAVFTVDAHGVATGIGTGSATLTAAYQGRSATTPAVQVTPAVVASMGVTPAGASVVTGSTQQYTATATYTDATTQDVTGSAAWSSSTLSVATISSSGLATGILQGTTTIAAQSNGITGSTTLTVTPLLAPILTLIVVTPSLTSVAKGNTQQFTATGTYSDGSMQNLTSQATWQSSVPAVATINNQGLATSISGGNTQVWATYGSISGVSALSVSSATLVSLSVTPGTATLANGTSQQYRAVGTLSDGSTQDLTTSVTWTSGNTSAATVNATGLASALGTGASTITAQAGAVNGTASLTVTSATVVSVQVIPAIVTLPAGGTQQLTVTALFTDGSSQTVTSSAAYASSNTGVATVTSPGKLTATGAGASSLTVSLGSASAIVPVVVTSAVLTSVAITPTSLSLAIGESQQLTATGTFSDGSTEDLTSTAVWLSTAPSIVSVSLSGKVLVNLTGSATVSATVGLISGSSALTATSAVLTGISLSPESVTLAAGQTQLFTATATLSDGTQQNVSSSANFSTSDSTKGTISNILGTNGLLMASGAGSFTIAATLNSISGSTTVTVTSAVLVSLTVSPSLISVPAGTTQQLTVTGNYSDGSTANVTSAASWISSSAAVASVDSSGVLHGVSSGSATVTAHVGLISQVGAVTVTSATLSSISVTLTAPSVPLGVHAQLSAIGTYSDSSTADITSQVQWSSSSAAVATVSVSGFVSTLSAGPVQITASLGAINNQVTLTVSAAVLQSIAVEGGQSSFALGLSLGLTAVGTYSDSSTQDLTNLVVWSSQTPTIGVVSSLGVATGVTTGTFSARATLSGVTGSLFVTITNALLQSITISPANATILDVLGGHTQYSATGHFSDGSTQDITTTCHWAITSGLSLGSISQLGIFSPLGIGLGSLSVTSGSISASTGFTIIL